MPAHLIRPGQHVKITTADGYQYGTVVTITGPNATVKLWDWTMPRMVAVAQLVRLTAKES